MYQRARYLNHEEGFDDRVRAWKDGWVAGFQNEAEGTAHTRAMFKELKTTVTVTEGSSTLFERMAGCRIAVRGTAGPVDSVKIGENGIVGGAMNVQKASITLVKDAVMYRIHMIQGEV